MKEASAAPANGVLRGGSPAYIRVCVVLGLVLTTACAGTRAPSFPTVADVSSSELQPGDVIEVRYLYWPELQEADNSQTIRPDGKVTLELVGDVQASGLTPSALTQRLKELYATKIKEPEITVIVRSLPSHVVYVVGEVRRPSAIQLVGEMTPLEAIAAAGGYLNRSAKLSEVAVLRYKDGRRHSRSIDISDVLANKRRGSFYLAPKDVVYVPRMGIDRANQWIDQYINRLIPGLSLGRALAAP